MPNSPELTQPMQYGAGWLSVGIALILLAIGVNAWVFIITRKRKIRSMATLPALPPAAPPLDALRQKYFSLITEIEMKYHQKEIVARTAYQLLSITLRLFVHEARGIATHKLTLAEIKRAGLENLGGVIEQYYPPEFSALDPSEVDKAIAVARKMVQEWS